MSRGKIEGLVYYTSHPSNVQAIAPRLQLGFLETLTKRKYEAI